MIAMLELPETKCIASTGVCCNLALQDAVELLSSSSTLQAALRGMSTSNSSCNTSCLHFLNFFEGLRHCQRRMRLSDTWKLLLSALCLLNLTATIRVLNVSYPAHLRFPTKRERVRRKMNNSFGQALKFLPRTLYNLLKRRQMLPGVS